MSSEKNLKKNLNLLIIDCNSYKAFWSVWKIVVFLFFFFLFLLELQEHLFCVHGIHPWCSPLANLICIINWLFEWVKFKSAPQQKVEVVLSIWMLSFTCQEKQIKVEFISFWKKYILHRFIIIICQCLIICVMCFSSVETIWIYVALKGWLIMISLF